MWHRPIAVGLAALVVATTFVTLRLQSYDWNPTGFVHAGGLFVDSAAAPAGLLVRRGEVGFDGTGFYRLALNPVTTSVAERGIEFDLPAFRQQRILYPLLAWAVVGGGRAQAVPWALIGINLAAFFALGWLGGSLAVAFGRSTWWGLAVPAYPGFAVALGLDTAEIVAAAFALAGTLALVRSRLAWATAAFTAAMFTRETTLLFVFGAAIAWAVARRTGRRTSYGVAVFVVPLTSYIAWQGILWHLWGTLPLRQGGGLDIAFPLFGLFKNVAGWPSTDAKQAAFHYILAIAMAVFFITVVRESRRTSVPNFVRLGAGLALALSLLLSEAIWLHHWGFLRAFTEAYLLGTLVLLGSSRVRLDRFLIASCTLWMAIAVNLLAHP